MRKAECGASAAPGAPFCFDAGRAAVPVAAVCGSLPQQDDHGTGCEHCHGPALRTTALRTALDESVGSDDDVSRMQIECVRATARFQGANLRQSLTAPPLRRQASLSQMRAEDIDVSRVKIRRCHNAA